jgi:hypothetical protein
MQIDYVKISCKEDVHICRTNFVKKWNEICMKQLAVGKHMENDCFSRTLKFKMKISHYQNNISTKTCCRNIHTQWFNWIPFITIKLETDWLTQAQLQPAININLYHHFLNQLILQHITNLSQLILPNGTQLMNDAEYQTYHHKPTKIIYSAQKLASQLFCYPPCNHQCQHPCTIHLPSQHPLTLIYYT